MKPTTMRNHLTRHIALLIATTLLSLYGLAHAAETPAKSEYVTTSTDPTQNTPPQAKPAKPKEEPPKKTKYDKLPLPELIEKAEKNDLIAQFELASRYNYGRTVPKDTATSLRWLRKAAGAGQLDAMKLLAIKLYSGYDVEPNYKEALKWANKLAETGDVAAAMMMGHMYATGEAGKRDLPRAYTWYAIAASGEKTPDDAADVSDEQLKQNELIQQAEEQREKMAGLISAREEAKAQKNASTWWVQHQDSIAKTKADKARKKAEEEAELLAAQKAAKR